MVLFVLKMKGELENVSTVSIALPLVVDVRNPLNDFEERKGVEIEAELLELEHEKSKPHNFHVSWEGNQKAATLTVLTPAQAKTAFKKSKNKSLLPRDYTASDSGTFVGILLVEVRGLEPFGFQQADFTVTSEGGTVFTEDVDFSEGDWADYDAEHDAPVSISDIEFQWEAI